VNGSLKMRANAFVVMIASALAFGRSAAAAPSPSPTPNAPTPAPRTSAFIHLVTEIATNLGQVPAGALVVASPVRSDVYAPRSEELAARFAAQLAGRFSSARAHPQSASLAVARSVSGRAPLIFVQLEIQHGTLRATGDLYPAVSNGWDRLRDPRPPPRAHAFASSPLDAELRTFLSPILLEQASVHKAKYEQGDVLAIGCGDLDGDGGAELVVVSRARVSIGRVRGEKFVVEKSVPWPNLASRVPVPMREPIGTVLVSPRGHRGEIFIGTTDRNGIVADADLVTRRTLTGLPVPGLDGDACIMQLPEAGAFEARAVACMFPAKEDPATIATLPKIDAASAFALVGKNGSVAEVFVAREPNGTLHIRQTSPGAPNVEATMDDAGAQLALADLDLDGVAEVITTANGAGDDVITVSSLEKSALVPRLRIPAPEGVRALGVCPPEERGVPALVAVVGSEVWLVR